MAKGKEAKALLEAKGLEADRGKEVAPKIKGSELVKLKVMAQGRTLARARLLILLSPSQPAKKTLLQPRLSLGFFSSFFFFLYFSFVVAVCHCLLCIFLLFIEKTLTFAL